MSDIGPSEIDWDLVYAWIHEQSVDVVLLDEGDEWTVCRLDSGLYLRSCVVTAEGRRRGIDLTRWKGIFSGIGEVRSR